MLYQCPNVQQHHASKAVHIIETILNYKITGPSLCFSSIQCFVMLALSDSTSLCSSMGVTLRRDHFKRLPRKALFFVRARASLCSAVEALHYVCAQGEIILLLSKQFGSVNKEGESVLIVVFKLLNSRLFNSQLN